MSVPFPPRGQITIWCPKTGVSVTGMLLELKSADPGGASYTDEARKGQKPLGEFDGEELAKLTFLMRIDREISGAASGSVWDDLSRLQGFMKPSAAIGRPHAVRVLGEIPFAPSDRWRLESAPRVARRNRPGSRTELRYVDVDVSLSEWEVASDMLAKATPQRTRDKEGRRRVRVIRTRPGQTMRSVAYAELGNHSRWRDLRTWNPSLAKVDPDAQLRDKTRIVIR